MQRGQGRTRVTLVHGHGQLADGAAKAPAGAQHHGLLGQRHPLRGLEPRRNGLARQARHPFHGVRAITAGLGAAAQVTQHGPGLHRGQLVLVAQQHQAGRGRQGVEQGGHHLQVHHGGLVHDEHVHIQRPARMVAEMPGAGVRAQQGMQGARAPHALHQPVQVQGVAQLGLQVAQGAVDGLLEPRRRLARGCSQGHAQLPGVGRRGEQQGQQAGCGVGLARAGAAGDDGQAPAQGQGAGHLLPVAVSAASGREKPVEPLPGCRHVHAALVCGGLAALADMAGHHALMVPVAAQVEQGGRPLHPGQHQGLALVGAMARTPHQAAGLQRLQPGWQGCGQLPPQGLQGLAVRGHPAQHGRGGGHQLGQRQAAVAPPLHLRHHRGGHQHAGPGLGVVPLHEGRQGCVQAAQQARVGPLAQQLQRAGGCQCCSHPGA